VKPTYLSLLHYNVSVKGDRVAEKLRLTVFIYTSFIHRE